MMSLRDGSRASCRTALPGFAGLALSSEALCEARRDRKRVIASTSSTVPGTKTDRSHVHSYTPDVRRRGRRAAAGRRLGKGERRSPANQRAQWRAARPALRRASFEVSRFDRSALVSRSPSLTVLRLPIYLSTHVRVPV